MSDSAFDQKYGKHFDFPTIDNSSVIVQSAGFRIAISIKSSHYKIIHTWFLSYPFNSIDNYDIPANTGWDISIAYCKANEIKIAFGAEGINNYSYVLTLICTDPYVKEKPVVATWE